MAHDTIVVLDYGSQTAPLIARRLRELGVYSELLPWRAARERVMGLAPQGFVLSGGPNSVYDDNAPTLPDYVLDSGLPVLGICYGMQLLTHTMGGEVTTAPKREYGPAHLHAHSDVPLWAALPETLDVWMSHGDRVEALPPDFESLAHTDNAPFAAMGDRARGLFGVQFHPEVSHTPRGTDILRNFALEVCGCTPDWNAGEFIGEAIARVRAQVGEGRVLLGVSGGVDSLVTAALLHRAIGDALIGIFIDHGLLRLDEAAQVVETCRQHIGLNLVAIDASDAFLGALENVTDPEQKRKIIGERFVRTFEQQAARVAEDFGQIGYLAQGTIYSDVIESAAEDQPDAQRIKSHHNVAGLPDDVPFELVEPLRYLFKDEVRKVGEALGLPHEVVWRQPFPGPGLAIRCLGALTRERVARLRAADAIFSAELQSDAQVWARMAQSFAVLLPVKSVGVMGDQRTYGETVVLRAVTSDDFMTADWARLPYDLLSRASARIVNEVPGVSRVVYDVTSKPPATIEWE